MSSSSEQDEISGVRRYFRLADQGRPEVLDLEGALEYLQHDYDTMNELAEKVDVKDWTGCFTPDGTFTDMSIGVTYRGPDGPTGVGKIARS
jgi:hypothetical protein